MPPHIRDGTPAKGLSLPMAERTLHSADAALERDHRKRV